MTLFSNLKMSLKESPVRGEMTDVSVNFSGVVRERLEEEKDNHNVNFLSKRTQWAIEEMKYCQRMTDKKFDRLKVRVIISGVKEMDGIWSYRAEIC